MVLEHMSSFNSIRWSPNTDLSKTNMQQIFDNDKKLYDDLTKYNSGFSFSEIEVTTQYSLTASKSNLLDATTRKLFYETTGSNVSLKLPGTNQVSSGTSWVMFGCRVTFKDNGTTDLIRKRPIGIFFATADEDNENRPPKQLYAMFNNYASASNTNMYSVCSGKMITSYTNADTNALIVDFDIYVFSTASGECQILTTDNYKAQFWAMRVE